ncbi:MAG: ArsR/SmtB family transcription factor [Promethearchaeota archaeon]
MEAQQFGALEEPDEIEKTKHVVDFKNQILVLKALGSDTRLKIVRLLRTRRNDAEGGLDISSLAYLLNQTEANISAQCKRLEKANLINITYKPGGHGVRKICQVAFRSIEFLLD